MKLKAELCFALSRLEIEDYYDEKQFHSNRPKMYQYNSNAFDKAWHSKCKSEGSGPW